VNIRLLALLFNRCDFLLSLRDPLGASKSCEDISKVPTVLTFPGLRLSRFLVYVHPEAAAYTAAFRRTGFALAAILLAAPQGAYYRDIVTARPLHFFSLLVQAFDFPTLPVARQAAALALALLTLPAGSSSASSSPSPPSSPFSSASFSKVHVGRLRAAEKLQEQQAVLLVQILSKFSEMLANEKALLRGDRVSVLGVPLPSLSPSSSGSPTAASSASSLSPFQRVTSEREYRYLYDSRLSVLAQDFVVHFPFLLLGRDSATAASGRRLFHGFLHLLAGLETPATRRASPGLSRQDRMQIEQRILVLRLVERTCSAPVRSLWNGSESEFAGEASGHSGRQPGGGRDPRLETQRSQEEEMKALAVRVAVEIHRRAEALTEKKCKEAAHAASPKRSLRGELTQPENERKGEGHGEGEADQEERTKKRSSREDADVSAKEAENEEEPWTDPEKVDELLLCWQTEQREAAMKALGPLWPQLFAYPPEIKSAALIPLHEAAASLLFSLLPFLPEDHEPLAACLSAMAAAAEALIKTLAPSVSSVSASISSPDPSTLSIPSASLSSSTRFLLLHFDICAWLYTHHESYANSAYVRDVLVRHVPMSALQRRQRRFFFETTRESIPPVLPPSPLARATELLSRFLSPATADSLVPLLADAIAMAPLHPRRGESAPEVPAEAHPLPALFSPFFASFPFKQALASRHSSPPSSSPSPARRLVEGRSEVPSTPRESPRPLSSCQGLSSFHTGRGCRSSSRLCAELSGAAQTLSLLQTLAASRRLAKERREACTTEMVAKGAASLQARDGPANLRERRGESQRGTLLLTLCAALPSLLGESLRPPVAIENGGSPPLNVRKKAAEILSGSSVADSRGHVGERRGVVEASDKDEDEEELRRTATLETASHQPFHSLSEAPLHAPIASLALRRLLDLSLYRGPSLFPTSSLYPRPASSFPPSYPPPFPSPLPSAFSSASFLDSVSSATAAARPAGGRSREASGASSAKAAAIAERMRRSHDRRRAQERRAAERRGERGTVFLLMPRRVPRSVSLPDAVGTSFGECEEETVSAVSVEALLSCAAWLCRLDSSFASQFTLHALQGLYEAALDSASPSNSTSASFSSSSLRPPSACSSASPPALVDNFETSVGGALAVCGGDPSCCNDALVALLLQIACSFRPQAIRRCLAPSMVFAATVAACTRPGNWRKTELRSCALRLLTRGVSCALDAWRVAAHRALQAVSNAGREQRRSPPLCRQAKEGAAGDARLTHLDDWEVHLDSRQESARQLVSAQADLQIRRLAQPLILALRLSRHLADDPGTDNAWVYVHLAQAQLRFLLDAGVFRHPWGKMLELIAAGRVEEGARLMRSLYAGPERRSFACEIPRDAGDEAREGAGLGDRVRKDADDERVFRLLSEGLKEGEGWQHPDADKETEEDEQGWDDIFDLYTSKAVSTLQGRSGDLESPAVSASPRASASSPARRGSLETDGWSARKIQTRREREEDISTPFPSLSPQGAVHLLQVADGAPVRAALFLSLLQSRGEASRCLDDLSSLLLTMPEEPADTLSSPAFVGFDFYPSLASLSLLQSPRLLLLLAFHLLHRRSEIPPACRLCLSEVLPSSLLSRLADSLPVSSSSSVSSAFFGFLRLWRVTEETPLALASIANSPFPSPGGFSLTERTQFGSPRVPAAALPPLAHCLSSIFSLDPKSSMPVRPSPLSRLLSLPLRPGPKAEENSLADLYDSALRVFATLEAIRTWERAWERELRCTDTRGVGRSKREGVDKRGERHSRSATREPRGAGESPERKRDLKERGAACCEQTFALLSSCTTFLTACAATATARRLAWGGFPEASSAVMKVSLEKERERQRTIRSAISKGDAEPQRTADDSANLLLASSCWHDPDAFETIIEMKLQEVEATRDLRKTEHIVRLCRTELDRDRPSEGEGDARNVLSFLLPTSQREAWEAERKIRIHRLLVRSRELAFSFEASARVCRSQGDAEPRAACRLPSSVWTSCWQESLSFLQRVRTAAGAEGGGAGKRRTKESEKREGENNELRTETEEGRVVRQKRKCDQERRGRDAERRGMTLSDAASDLKSIDGQRNNEDGCAEGLCFSDWGLQSNSLIQLEKVQAAYWEVARVAQVLLTWRQRDADDRERNELRQLAEQRHRENEGIGTQRSPSESDTPQDDADLWRHVEEDFCFAILQLLQEDESTSRFVRKAQSALPAVLLLLARASQPVASPLSPRFSRSPPARLSRGSSQARGQREAKRRRTESGADSRENDGAQAEEERQPKETGNGAREREARGEPEAEGETGERVQGGDEGRGRENKEGEEREERGETEAKFESGPEGDSEMEKTRERHVNRFFSTCRRLLSRIPCRKLLDVLEPALAFLATDQNGLFRECLFPVLRKAACDFPQAVVYPLMVAVEAQELRFRASFSSSSPLSAAASSSASSSGAYLSLRNNELRKGAFCLSLLLSEATTRAPLASPFAAAVELLQQPGRRAEKRLLLPLFSLLEREVTRARRGCAQTHADAEDEREEERDEERGEEREEERDEEREEERGEEAGEAMERREKRREKKKVRRRARYDEEFLAKAMASERSASPTAVSELRRLWRQATDEAILFERHLVLGDRVGTLHSLFARKMKNVRPAASNRGANVKRAPHALKNLPGMPVRI
ncbi:phosphatidylinositol 3- and 4-kinase, partial [Toxoplasma gondii ARI]